MVGPVLVVGDINADLSVAIPFYPNEGGESVVSTLQWYSGGAGVNVSTALALLGTTALLLGRVGTDLAGAQALAAAQRARVDLRLIQHDPTHPTGICYTAVSPSGERTFFSFRGANVVCDAIPDATLLSHCACVHCSAYTLLEGAQRESSLATLRLAHKLAVPISLDLAPPTTARCADLLLELLPLVDLLFLNERELATLLPGLGEAAALERLRSLSSALIALKRGANGASIFVGASRFDIPALAVEACASNGCGDAFAAGFIWARLVGAEPATCAAIGTLVAGLTATSYGTADALPSSERLLAAARMAPPVFAAATALLNTYYQ